ncbi:uncharacterized protein [Miscanthus floridulus]|uniref:uncharacterized protein n=1 Tax=Miscanthus floridulus TaxID=154761 RepID=UPI00345A7998
MASKALLLFARAARSAAAATYRVASLAERRALSPSPEAVAAASDGPRLSGGRSAAAGPTHGTAAPPPAMDAPSPRTGSWVASAAPSSKDLSKPGDRVEFVPKEEDVESDEALRDLYERWCKAFNQKREPDEMARRFNKFKNRVLRIHSMNKANQSCKVGLTKFSDGKLAEMRANRDPHDCMLAQKFPNSCLLWKGDGKFLKEVFADFDVVNGKLFVYFPLEKGTRVADKKEISTEYEVVYGRLFVADLPEGRKLLVPNNEFIKRRWIPYLP